jgi:hypothetical protein
MLSKSPGFITPSLNSTTAFAAIVGHCDTLQQTGLFKSKAAKLFSSFTQELQAEINQEFLEDLHQLPNALLKRFYG